MALLKGWLRAKQIWTATLSIKNHANNLNIVEGNGEVEGQAMQKKAMHSS